MTCEQLVPESSVVKENYWPGTRKQNEHVQRPLGQFAVRVTHGYPTWLATGDIL